MALKADFFFENFKVTLVVGYKRKDFWLHTSARDTFSQLVGYKRKGRDGFRVMVGYKRKGESRNFKNSVVGYRRKPEICPDLGWI